MSDRQALVVDDSRSACFAMRKYLEHYNYLVTTALSATEGLRYLQDNRPTVIFLDQLMPGITGLEMLRTLKTDPNTVTIPVVMCTSVERPDFKVEARDSGAIEVLNKPPNLDLLDELLTSIERPDLDLSPTLEIATTEHLQRLPAEAVVMVPEQVQQYATLREEINEGLRHLTDEIFVQISELRAQVHQIEEGQLTGPDRDDFRQIAREEADSLYRSVQAEMNLIRRKLDAMDALHRRDRAELQREVPPGNVDVRSVAEQAVADAVNRFSRSLTDAIVKALGNP
jgi:CheY-like chemotaxis protein